MSVDMKVPEIRFEGFGGEWVEKNLGEIGSLKNGMNFDKTAMGHGHPFVNLQDVFGKNEVSSKNLGLAFGTENQRKDYCLNEGDVLFIRSSVKPEGVGEAAVVPKNMLNTTYSGFIIRFRPDIEMAVNFNRFVYSTANSRKQILASSTSSTSSANSNINQDSLQRIQLALPCKQEQTQIGNYFQKLDSLINQHQQKHDKLSSIKKAMLGKMFPKQGETTPEIRFKGFSGEWDEKSLGEVFNYERPDNYIVESAEYSDKYSTPVLTANKGFLLGYTNEESTYNDPSIVFDDFTLDSKFVDFPYMVKSSAIKILTVKDRKKDDLLFAFHLLNTTRIEVMGHARHYISIVQNTKVMAPKKNEQTAISNYFQKLDSLINQHQQKITKLNNIKQACLNKMFV